MSTAKAGGNIKPAFYDDNKWHVVSILVMATEIQIHVDDYDFLRWVSTK